MKDHRIDAAQQAVEQLADSIGPLPPPRGLKAGRRRGVGGVAGLALLLAAAAALAWWALSPGIAPVPARDEAGVVVEHLRIRGRSVQAKVEQLPEAGAVMVTMAEDADESAVPDPEKGDS